MAYRSIIVKGEGVRYEGKANAAITPGHLVEQMSTGNIRVHASAGGNAMRAFAVENDLEGEEIGDAYVANERVQYNIFQNGDVVYGILADGQNASIGSKLESNGNGELRVAGEESSGESQPESIVGLALDAVDASDSATTTVANRRIRCQII